jgi:Putative lactococcus lactis phage r1t holin
MWTKAFWTATLERSIKTFAQSWAAVLVANGTGILDTAWEAGLSVAGMAALLSVLTSVGSAGVGPAGPSLASESIEQG